MYGCFHYLNSPGVCHCHFVFLISTSGDLIPFKFCSISVLKISFLARCIYVCLCKFVCGNTHESQGVVDFIKLKL